MSMSAYFLQKCANGSRSEGKKRGWFMLFQTCSSVNLSDAEEAEVSVSAELLSGDLRRHSQLRRSIPGAGRPNADGCLSSSCDLISPSLSSAQPCMIELETREKRNRSSVRLSNPILLFLTRKRLNHTVSDCAPCSNCREITVTPNAAIWSQNSTT
jgi:hypothetical protein